MLRLTGLEADKQRLSAEVGHEQRLIHDERGLASCFIQTLPRTVFQMLMLSLFLLDPGLCGPI